MKLHHVRWLRSALTAVVAALVFGHAVLALADSQPVAVLDPSLQADPAVGAFDVPAPPAGVSAAMTDAQAGGSHALDQDFVVPAGITGGTVSFALFINSGDAHADRLGQATTALNQQARVDILGAGSDPFSVAAADLLLDLFQSAPGGALALDGVDRAAIRPLGAGVPKPAAWVPAPALGALAVLVGLAVLAGLAGAGTRRHVRG